MTHPFDGIAEKLNRSKQNILNLEAEIDRFFQESKYPIICDDNKKVIPEAIEYHRNRTVPLRFALLAGEVIHHLRSILDHIVWQFSEPSYRATHWKFIEFPILEARPPKKDLFTRYERKIKGITKPEVRNFIERLQPYNCREPIDSLLLVIHNFDVIDKHRELVVLFSTGAIELPMSVFDRFVRYQYGVPGSAPVSFQAEFERNGKIVSQIAFPQYGRAKSEPVVQALNELQNFIVGLVSDFDRLLG
jgi:hypothetical protein